MSSAVEVLKDELESKKWLYENEPVWDRHLCNCSGEYEYDINGKKGKKIEPNKRIITALEEALLALEKKEDDRKQGVLDYRKSIVTRLKEMESKGKTIIEVKELIQVLKEFEGEVKE